MVVLQRPRMAWVVLGLCQAFALLVVVTQAHRAWGDAPYLQPSSFAGTYIDWLDKQGQAQRGEKFKQVVNAAKDEARPLPRAVSGLKGADVFVMFVESYGGVALKLHEGKPFVRWTDELEPWLAEAGLHVATAMTAPSLRGGGSSLSHATFSSGVPLASRYEFDLLLEAGVVTLPQLFAEAGYRTINLQPAMPAAWPDSREVFGYTEDWFSEQLPYRGRRFHFGRVPDQWSLGYLQHEILQDRSEPAYVQFVAVGSHYPFSVIPHYIDDWDQTLDLEHYQTLAAEFDLGINDMMVDVEVQDAYLKSVHYSLKAMLGFARERTRPFLMFVLGDHQPPAFFGSVETDGSLDVPVHVLSNQSELLEPFLAQEFVPGMTPSPDAETFAMARFIYRLRRAFGQ